MKLNIDGWNAHPPRKEGPLDYLPKDAPSYEFVCALLERVPELQHVWDETVADDDDFYPSPFFYDLARGLVSLAEEAMNTKNSSAGDALKRAYDCFEYGMSLPQASGVPSVIHTSLGDWLGRQASNARLFRVLSADMGRLLRASLRIDKDCATNESTIKNASPSPIPFAEPAHERRELEIISSGYWSYFFMRLVGTDRHFLDVLCGTSATYTVTIEFTAPECSEYERLGNDMIEDLVKAIQYSPSTYAARKVRLPPSWIRATEASNTSG